jgi:putative proteasome-type protease
MIGPMTYCIGVLLQEGVVMASDSRTHAGVDNFATFCKMTVFERPGDRVVILLSSGSLAGTQSVVSILKQRGQSRDPGTASIWNACTLFDIAMLVSDAVREIERRDSEYLAKTSTPFNASFIIGGQIKGEPPRLFRTFAEGNFIEAGPDTPFFQTGETKYGKPIIDRVIAPSTSLSDAMKCVLVSFDSTMRSNLSVGMPIDLACYTTGDLKLTTHHRFASGDAYFATLSREWSDGVRQVFRGLPPVPPPSSTPSQLQPGDRSIRFDPAP